MSLLLLKRFARTFGKHRSARMLNVHFRLTYIAQKRPCFESSLINYRGAQRRFPPKYTENTFWAIQSTFTSLEMHSERRYKICICSVILRELQSFRNYKGFSIIFPKILDAIWRIARLQVVPHFSSEIVKRAKRERVKITPREKRRHAGGREFKSLGFVCSPSFSSLPAACRLFSRGVIFTRARVSLALLSLRKNGGLLVV